MANYFAVHSRSIRRDLKLLALRKSDHLSKYGGCETDNQHLSALELGSGNGFLSVCLAAVARDLFKELVVTDLQDHLELIERTLMANSHIISLDSPACLSERGSSARTDNSPLNTIVIEHRWGEFDLLNGNQECTVESVRRSHALSGSKTFDFIFGTDVAYRNYLYESLIASLKRFSHQHTISLIGVTMMDTEANFFFKLREAGFRYYRLADHLMDAEFRGNTFGIFVIQLDNKARR